MRKKRNGKKNTNWFSFATTTTWLWEKSFFSIIQPTGEARGNRKTQLKTSILHMVEVCGWFQISVKMVFLPSSTIVVLLPLRNDTSQRSIKPEAFFLASCGLSRSKRSDFWFIESWVDRNDFLVDVSWFDCWIHWDISWFNCLVEIFLSLASATRHGLEAFFP